MVDRTIKKDVCIDEKGRVIMSTPDADKPNPSVIIAEAIDRAIANATAIQVARFDATHTRVDGVEKAVEVFQADLTRVPTQLDRAIAGQSAIFYARLDAIGKDLDRIYADLGMRGSDISEAITHLRDLSFGKIQELSSVTTERFTAVAAQFAERDTRTDQRAGDTKLAVDAAFAAAKEATGEIKTGFTKQIDAMVVIIDTKTNNLSSTLGDLKERFTALEARTQGLTAGRETVRTEQQDTRGIIFGVLGIMIGGAALLVSVLVHFLK